MRYFYPDIPGICHAINKGSLLSNSTLGGGSGDAVSAAKASCGLVAGDPAH